MNLCNVINQISSACEAVKPAYLDACHRTLHTQAGDSSCATMKTDLTGKTFGRLTVIKFSYNNPKIGNFWLCQCRCGNTCEKTTSKLQDKHNLNPSCGCARKESILKAGKIALAVTTKFSHPNKQKLKWVYRNMVNRCHKPGAKRYERYGARGISVCEEWRKNPTSFFEWAVKAGYQLGLSIERINNDGNYEPSNCKWIPIFDQQSNTSKNVFLTWNNQTLTVAQWARKIGVKYGFIQGRLYSGWSIEEIFTTPRKK